MPVWRLVPIDLTDPAWEGSSRRGLAVVRAKTEERARSVAEEAFGVKTRFPPRGGLHVPSWTHSTLVRAEIIDDARYSPEGAETVLEPSF
jgi:hypothetical protein